MTVNSSLWSSSQSVTCVTSIRTDSNSLRCRRNLVHVNVGLVQEFYFLKGFEKIHNGRQAPYVVVVISELDLFNIYFYLLPYFHMIFNAEFINCGDITLAVTVRKCLNYPFM